MSIIIRLQNLPWSANSVDIRRYFTGLSIPEGGVHIVGGEMGDAFIAFSTDEDARLAMAKDGGKIKDMQIKLLLSSRTEMARVIEQARQQNLGVSVQPIQPAIIPPQIPVLPPPPQPARIMAPAVDSDRRVRSPSPRRRSREKSPSRDRRRTPDRRSSKRDRSRSPVRSSRGSSRDTDRRSDRFKRDDRRYDESSRYRDERRSGRDGQPEVKKYPDADHVNSRSQLHATEGFRETSHGFYDSVTSTATTGNYSYSNPQSSASNKVYPGVLYNLPPTDQNASTHQTDLTGMQKSDIAPVMDPRTSAGQQAMLYGTLGYEQRNTSTYDQQSVQPYEQKNISDFEQKSVPPYEERNASSYEQRNTPTYEQRSTPTYEPRNAAASYDQRNAPVFDQRNVQPYEQRNQPSYDQRNTVPKDTVQSNDTEQQFEKQRRHTRFEPEFQTPQQTPFFSSSEPNHKVSLSDSRESSSYDGNKQMPPDPRAGPRNAWPRQTEDRTENSSWTEKRQGLLDPPVSNNSDFVQVVPMELEPTADAPIEENVYIRPEEPQRAPLLSSRPGHPFPRGNSPRNDEVRREMPNRRGPNDHQQRGTPTLTVEVSRLPPNARVDDILRLFHGIPISPSNIRMQSNVQGAEKAFVRFANPADFEEALTRHTSGQFEVHSCPSASFDAALRSQKPRPKPKPREEDLCIQMRGLPFSCKEDDVVCFFDGLGILDLFIDVGPDGRATGIGYVELGTPEDFRSALAMNGKMIGHRYITVSVASKEMMALAKGEEYIPPPPQPMGPPRPSGPPRLSGPSRPSGPPPHNQVSNQNRSPPFCISIRGLPECVTSRDIADFFSQINVIPRAIHIMFGPEKRPSGEGFVEFTSKREFEAAMETNGKSLLGNRVSLMSIPFREMNEIIRRPNPLPPPPTPGPLLRTPSEIERPRRPLLPQAPTDVAFRERPRRDPPIRGNRPRMEQFNRMEGPGRPPFSRMRGPYPVRPFGPESRFPPPADRSIKDFGAPGCVVSINNLHFRAGLEELLDFFRGYTISKDSIIRKYNENGQTTGEARVSFQNPREAQRAVRELNQKPVMGRPLTLSIL